MLLRVYLLWIGIASALCALAFFADKRAAIRSSGRRIPEISLLALMSLGGGFGGLFGIFCLRHKCNRRAKFHFRAVAVLSCIVQTGLLCLILAKEEGFL